MTYIYRSKILYVHICFAYMVRLPHMSSYSAIYVLTLAYRGHLHHILYVAYMPNVIMLLILCAYTCMYAGMYACIYVNNMSNIYDI